MDWNSIQCHLNALVAGGHAVAVVMLTGERSVMLESVRISHSELCHGLAAMLMRCVFQR